VRYLFIGKSGAILPENGRALVWALREIGFALNSAQEEEIVRGKAVRRCLPQARGSRWLSGVSYR
jgi:hypothetical protein